MDIYSRMRIIYGRILSAVLCLMFAGVLSGRDDTGAQASITGFALPQYRKGDNRLQFILYGKNASNLGSVMVLKDLRLDIIRDSVKSVNEIIALDQAPVYPINSTSAFVADYWKDKGHSHALLFTPSGTYDKNARTLRGEEKIHFRSRELDIDGVGFDAFSDRRFIHIRSNVRVVIRPEARDRSLKQNGLKGGKKDSRKNSIKSNTGDVKK
ncbi:MAG: hypothetical protein IKA79_08100 [Lentisphaeria bacterium]|nr:hypothetical protein [Lentisphaeria bacterium]